MINVKSIVVKNYKNNEQTVISRTCKEGPNMGREQLLVLNTRDRITWRNFIDLGWLLDEETGEKTFRVMRDYVYFHKVGENTIAISQNPQI